MFLKWFAPNFERQRMELREQIKQAGKRADEVVAAVRQLKPNGKPHPAVTPELKR